MGSISCFIINQALAHALGQLEEFVLYFIFAELLARGPCDYGRS
jgi:hypothetical protein